MTDGMVPHPNEHVYAIVSENSAAAAALLPFV